MSSPEIIAQGNSWGSPYVIQRLRSLGVREKVVQDVLFKVEQQFSVLGAHMGSRAEWSIRFSEVMGSPEDLQLDLDQLREAAITDAAEEHLED